MAGSVATFVATSNIILAYLSYICIALSHMKNRNKIKIYPGKRIMLSENWCASQIRATSDLLSLPSLGKTAIVATLVATFVGRALFNTGPIS
jgi:hypothetical protein